MKLPRPDWTFLRRAFAFAAWGGWLLDVSLPLRAAEHRVPEDFPTIQGALEAAANGDTVSVAPGQYEGPLVFAGKDVRLQSRMGPQATRLLGRWGAIVSLGPRGELVGFTLEPAVGAEAQGVVVQGDGSVIRGNVFAGLNLGASGGSAVHGNGASPRIEGNLFRGLGTDASFLSGGIVFYNTSSPWIFNNTFESNACRAINLTLPEGSLPQVINNTFVANDTAIRYDGRVNCRAQIYRNNLLFGNTNGLVVEFGIEANNAVWEHNLVYSSHANYVGLVDPTGSAGNLAVDPLLERQDSGFYALRKGSPAIDAGTPTLAPTTDAENDPRPVDGTQDGVAGFDIGADEWIARPPRPPTGLTARSGDREILLTWQAQLDVEGYRVHRALDPGGPYRALATLPTPGYLDSTVVNEARYYYVVSALNEFGESPPSTEVSVLAGNRPPQPQADSVSTPEDQQLEINVLANDTDPNLDPLGLVSYTQPDRGVVELRPPATLVFTPRLDVHGTTQFEYTVTDGRGAVGVAAVTVVVTPVNDAPGAVSGSVQGTAGAPLLIQLAGQDVDGDPLTFRLVRDAAAGLLRGLDPVTGRVSYTPAHGFAGFDTFEYVVEDGTTRSAPAFVRIQLEPPIDRDRNELPDDWERLHDLGNPNADRDADGLTHLEEYRANTDPDDPGSRLVLLSIVLDPAAHPVITWASVGATRYRVYYSDEPRAPERLSEYQPVRRAAELEIDPRPAGVPGTLTFTDDFALTGGASTNGVRYYRVAAVPF